MSEIKGALGDIVQKNSAVSFALRLVELFSYRKILTFLAFVHKATASKKRNFCRFVAHRYIYKVSVHS